MITRKNDFEKIKKSGTQTLPETVLKSHEFAVRSTNKEAQAKPHTDVVKGKSKQRFKNVEHIREEIKLIKRYVGFHNRIKSPSSILSLIKSLQRAIVQKLIRKTSPLADEIRDMQDKLISLYNLMKKDVRVKLKEDDLKRLINIAGGERVYASIGIIKRYIAIQGKKIGGDKVKRFKETIDNAFRNKKIKNDDPYLDRVQAIHNTVKRLKAGSTLNIGKAELKGLEGLVKECEYVKPSLDNIFDSESKALEKFNNQTCTDTKLKAYSDNKVLKGVLTADEMANRQLDLLPFLSFWHSLFGKPSWNFTMMFHGEPHNGKTIFLLKLAQYLAENFGHVLYVSSEEFASPTMTQKVNEFISPRPSRLHFAENLQDPDLSDYQFIILDSVNDLRLKINDYRELRKQHPDKAFIFILQHTKAGDFKGGKDWEHTAEIVGEVSKGTVNITKNRYAPKNSLDFFRQFGIQWYEPTT